MSNKNTAARIIALAAVSIWHAGQRYGGKDYTEAHLLLVKDADLQENLSNGPTDSHRVRYAQARIRIAEARKS